MEECSEIVQFKIISITCSHLAVITEDSCRLAIKTTWVNSLVTLQTVQCPEAWTQLVMMEAWWELVVGTDRTLKSVSVSRICKLNKTSVNSDNQVKLPIQVTWRQTELLITRREMWKRHEEVSHSWRSECQTVATVGKKLQPLTIVLRERHSPEVVFKLTIQCKTGHSAKMTHRVKGTIHIRMLRMWLAMVHLRDHPESISLRSITTASLVIRLLRVVSQVGLNKVTTVKCSSLTSQARLILIKIVSIALSKPTLWH